MSARQLGQVLLTLAFMPYDALVSLDAIGRTLLRLLVTRKRLLEWETSSDSERSSRNGFAGFCAAMWIAPVLAMASGFMLATLQPTQLPLALPILCLWLAAPWIAWRISRPIESPAPNLTVEQSAFLRRIARKSWHFSKTLSPRAKIGCPRTIFRRSPPLRSLRGPRPRTWAWRCWPTWPPGISDICRWAR